MIKKITVVSAEIKCRKKDIAQDIQKVKEVIFSFNMKIKTKQEIFVRRFDASSIVFTVR